VPALAVDLPLLEQSRVQQQWPAHQHTSATLVTTSSRCCHCHFHCQADVAASAALPSPWNRSPSSKQATQMQAPLQTDLQLLQ
jgi:hypothetical protein